MGFVSSEYPSIRKMDQLLALTSTDLAQSMFVHSTVSLFPLIPALSQMAAERSREVAISLHCAIMKHQGR